MKDTPETDKIWHALCDSWCNWSVDFAHEKLLDKSRELERERDEARRLAEKYRYLSCDSQEEADATLLPWENNQPTEP